MLAQWREAAAIRHDKPRGWILADDALREIAERMPSSTRDLEEVRSVPAGVVRRRGEEIVALVERGRADAVNEAAASTPPRPQPQQIALVTKLMGLARETAQHAKINAELLATRRDVEQLVFSRRTEHLLSGWRREIIGEPLLVSRQSNRDWSSKSQAKACSYLRRAFVARRERTTLALRDLLRCSSPRAGRRAAVFFAGFLRESASHSCVQAPGWCRFLARRRALGRAPHFARRHLHLAGRHGLRERRSLHALEHFSELALARHDAQQPELRVVLDQRPRLRLVNLEPVRDDFFLVVVTLDAAARHRASRCSRRPAWSGCCTRCRTSGRCGDRRAA